MDVKVEEDSGLKESGTIHIPWKISRERNKKQGFTIWGNEEREGKHSWRGFLKGNTYQKEVSRRKGKANGIRGTEKINAGKRKGGGPRKKIAGWLVF